MLKAWKKWKLSILFISICQYFIHASFSCLKIDMVEPHRESGNGDRSSNEPTCPHCDNGLCLVCGVDPGRLWWIVMGFGWGLLHILFPPGGFADTVLGLPRSSEFPSPSPVSLICGQDSFHSSVKWESWEKNWTQLCFECTDFYKVPAVSVRPEMSLKPLWAPSPSPQCPLFWTRTCSCATHFLMVQISCWIYRHAPFQQESWHRFYNFFFDIGKDDVVKHTT